MPEARTVKRAKAKLRRGNSPTTAAGEFVKEEIGHVRHGRHGARSPEQAIAIGLSKARRAGVPVPEKRTGVDTTKKKARRDRIKAGPAHEPDPRRSRATKKALEKAPHRTVSRAALSRHSRRVARRKRR